MCETYCNCELCNHANGGELCATCGVVNCNHGDREAWLIDAFKVHEGYTVEEINDLRAKRFITDNDLNLISKLLDSKIFVGLVDLNLLTGKFGAGIYYNYGVD